MRPKVVSEGDSSTLIHVSISIFTYPVILVSVLDVPKLLLEMHSTILRLACGTIDFMLAGCVITDLTCFALSQSVTFAAVLRILRSIELPERSREEK